MTNNKWVMFVFCVVVGLLVNLMGRKLFKVIIFIAGVLAMVALVMLIFYTTFLKSNTASWVGWVVLACSVLVGLLVGCLFLKIVKLGAFVLAAWGGFSLGLLLYEALPFLYGI